MTARSSWFVVCVALSALACAGNEDPNDEVDDGTCHIALSGDTLQVDVSMSTDARSVSVTRGNGESVTTYTFDPGLHLIRVEYAGIPARPATDYTYDAQGHMTDAITFGEPGNSCTNMYDVEDRLLSRDCDASQWSYGYDDVGRVEQVTMSDSGGQANTSTLDYDDDGRPISLESDAAAYSYAYDADGQLITRERDWVFGSGKDGTSDIRWTWRYRASGGVAAYEQDGTDHSDNPFIDGVADIRWSFTPSCDAIGQLHPWIYDQGAIVDMGIPVPPFPF